MWGYLWYFYLCDCFQAKGFELSYLEKVPEVKDTVHKQSLLHHVCSIVVEKFPESSDLYSEIGAITRSAKVSLSTTAPSPLILVDFQLLFFFYAVLGPSLYLMWYIKTIYICKYIASCALLEEHLTFCSHTVCHTYLISNLKIVQNLILSL